MTTQHPPVVPPARPHLLTLALVTGTRMTCHALTHQLTELLGDTIRIEGYALDATPEDGSHGLEGPALVGPQKVRADLVLLSTPDLLEHPRLQVEPWCALLVAKRVPNYQHLDRLLLLPAGTDVLLVNDVEETASDLREALQKIGIDHLHFHLYAPGLPLPDRPVDVAVTPGEAELVPPGIAEIIDIGPRLLDISTVMEIFSRFAFPDEDKISVSERYMQKIVQLGKSLADTTRLATRLHRQLKQVLDGVHEGILAVDHMGLVTVFNENLEHLARVPATAAVKKSLRHVIAVPELLRFLAAGGEEETQAFHVQGRDMLVTRIPQEHGFIATFKTLHDVTPHEKRWRRELVARGHIAKHTFADILGTSPAIEAARHTAQKLARTDLPVLIEGESGTGKELFAAAIHNASARAKGPFLAVNFSALSEDLVESELFGYEEGAFTGARKGGKPGLFEQAAGGTIFLDEMGDISLKIQARLLRVLQEKEVLRVGGHKIIPVDFRVVAATNKNLLQMIEDGQFREDLYHRLKVLHVKLPSLRERAGDIPILAKHFMDHSSFRPLSILASVYDKLYKYPWYGNVRELKNTIDYMCAVCEGEAVGLMDIPNESFFQRAPAHSVTTPPSALVDEPLQASESLWRELGEMGERDLSLALLAVIDERKRSGASTGRRSLSLHLRELGFHLSEQQIRKKMDKLEEAGYLTKTIGRSGSTLSLKGQQIVTVKRTHT